MKKLAVISLLVLSGCASPGSVKSLQPVCDALVGPIEYNPNNPKSNIYAAPGLAPSLAVRNHVGENLKCPEYQ